jgi:hypothetical protein
MEECLQSLSDSTFYLLLGRTDCARLDKQYANGLWQCRKCLTYRTSLEETDIVLKYLPPRASITSVWDTNLTLVSKTFYRAVEDVLGADCKNLFEIYDVHTNLERRMGYVVLRCKFHITVRGSEKVYYVICSECKNASYVAFGRRYLVEPFDRSIPVYASGAGMLVFRGDVLKSLHIHKAMNLYVENLGVEPMPLDGLPRDLPVVEI